MLCGHDETTQIRGITINGVGTKLYDKRLCENISFEIAMHDVSTSRRFSSPLRTIDVYLHERMQYLWRNSNPTHSLFLRSQAASTERSAETRAETRAETSVEISAEKSAEKSSIFTARPRNLT